MKRNKIQNHHWGYIGLENQVVLFKTVARFWVSKKHFSSELVKGEKKKTWARECGNYLSYAISWDEEQSADVQISLIKCCTKLHQSLLRRNYQIICEPVQVKFVLKMSLEVAIILPLSCPPSAPSLGLPSCGLTLSVA